LPEEWLIERNQQVGAISRKLLSPSFAVVCRAFAAVFCNLRYIFVTAAELIALPTFDDKSEPGGLR
jgi:hypothetical protein